MSKVERDKRADRRTATQGRMGVCMTGKRCYPSRKVARAAVKRTRRQMQTFRAPRLVRSVYKCRVCHFWHASSQERWS